MPTPAFVLNGTVLEVLDEHLEYMKSLGFAVETPPDRRPPEREALLRHIAGAEVVLGPGAVFDTAFFETAGRLRVLSLASSGFDRVDLTAATAAGVAVTNAATDLGCEAVAEIAWGLLLAAARRIADNHCRIVTSPPEKRFLPMQERPMGTLLYGKTLGVLGLGAIGRRMARRAAGWGMRILACDPYLDAAFASQWGIEGVDLDALLAESDILSLHLRDTPETRGLLHRERLFSMKEGAILVNTARHALVDEEALVAALTDGPLAAAGIDTAVDRPASPLTELRNVVCTAHLGNRCREAVFDVTRTAIDNAAALLRGEAPARHLLNPEVLEAPQSRLAGIET